MPAAPVESVTFSVYREETGGAPLWQETQNVNIDAEGQYTVLMGSTLNDGVPLDLFSSAEPRWLGIQFNRPAEVEQPRVRLASVPYALKASDAETLGGRPASAYLLAPNAAASDAATSAGSSISSESSSDRAVKPRLAVGNQNYLGMFTDSSNDLGNSLVYQNGTNIGIGTTNPLISLDVRTGALPQLGMAGTTDYLTFFASDVYGPAIYWDPNKDMRFGKGGSGLFNPYGFVEQMRIQSNTGNVGIGTKTPGFKLDVEGGAINGNNPATSGFAAGVMGTSSSPNGAGVSGFNTVTSGSGFPVGVAGSVNGNIGAGVAGNAQQTGASGVSGYNNAPSGFAVGVNGGTNSPNGAGVFGSNNATTPPGSNFGAGVQGNTNIANTYGVAGYNGATSGYAVGVQGNSNSPDGGAGVRGGTSSANAVGVQGNNNASSGYAIGVSGNTNSNAGAGVQGNAHNGGAFGVVGFNSATSGWAIGTQGATSSPGGIGLLGVDWACSSGSGCTLVGGTAAQLQTATDGLLLQGLSGAEGANTNTVTEVFHVSGQGFGHFAGGLFGGSNNVLPSGNPGVTGLNTATSGVAVGTAGASASPQGSGIAGLSGTCGESSCTVINGTAGFFFASNNNGGYLLRGFSGPQGGDYLSGTTQVFGVDGLGNVIVSNPGSGLILKSPDGTKCALISLANTGALTTTSVTCP